MSFFLNTFYVACAFVICVLKYFLLYLLINYLPSFNLNWECSDWSHTTHDPVCRGCDQP